MAEIIPRVYVRHRELPVGVLRVEGLEPQVDRFDWEGYVATEITDYNSSCRDGMKGSITADGMAAIIDQFVCSLLKKQDSQFANVFKRGYGNFINTLVNYDDHCDAEGRELEPRKGFARASVIHNPKDFFYNDNGKAEFETDENTRILRGIYVPETGYIALTEKGFLNPKTGLPYKTVGNDRGRAIESFTSRGFPTDVAELIASYFFSREEDKGVGAVGRRYWDDYQGYFFLSTDLYPDIKNSYIGRLASRSLSDLQGGLGTHLFRKKLH